MTNKEAIFKLIEYKRWLERNFEKFNAEPFDMAIGALEKQPCEDTIIDNHYWKGFSNGIRTEKFRESKRQELCQKPCEDCISRQAALNLIRGLTRWCVRSEDGKFNNVGLLYDDVMFGLDGLPPVTPQPKTGHWIDIETLDSALWHKCSECGETKFYATDYCPNCGAKMEVEYKWR